MDFKNVTFNKLDTLSLKDCNFQNLTVNNYIDDFYAIHCEATNLHYNLDSLDFLFNIADSLLVDNLYINSKCFNDKEKQDEEDIAIDFGDVQDLFKFMKLKKLYISGNNVNEKNLEKSVRGTSVKVIREEKIFDY